MFPERTWNTKESLPILPMDWGIIDISYITNSSIVPVVLEYIAEKCYIKYGDPIYINDNYKKRRRHTKNKL